MKNVLSDINLHIDSEKITILGSNGSGKTTIIKGIMGLATTTSGEIRIFGTNLKNASNVMGVACNLDTVYRLLDLTVKRKIEMYCSISGIDSEKVFKHIESYELSDILAKRTRELSTGQDKAFCNIMALDIGRRMALLDEPFEGLDARRRLMMVNDLKNFQGCVLMNTHDFGALKSLPNWGLYLIIDGNLYGKLNSAGYVTIVEHSFFSSKRITIKITEKGLETVRKYILAINELELGEKEEKNSTFSTDIIPQK